MKAAWFFFKGKIYSGSSWYFLVCPMRNGWQRPWKRVEISKWYAINFNQRWEYIVGLFLYNVTFVDSIIIQKYGMPLLLQRDCRATKFCASVPMLVWLHHTLFFGVCLIPVSDSFATLNLSVGKVVPPSRYALQFLDERMRWPICTYKCDFASELFVYRTWYYALSLYLVLFTHVAQWRVVVWRTYTYWRRNGYGRRISNVANVQSNIDSVCTKEVFLNLVIVNLASGV